MLCKTCGGICPPSDCQNMIFHKNFGTKIMEDILDDAMSAEKLFDLKGGALFDYPGRTEGNKRVINPPPGFPRKPSLLTVKPPTFNEGGLRRSTRDSAECFLRLAVFPGNSQPSLRNDSPQPSSYYASHNILTPPLRSQGTFSNVRNPPKSYHLNYNTHLSSSQPKIYQTPYRESFGTRSMSPALSNCNFLPVQDDQLFSGHFLEKAQYDSFLRRSRAKPTDAKTEFDNLNPWENLASGRVNNQPRLNRILEEEKSSYGSGPTWRYTSDSGIREVKKLNNGDWLKPRPSLNSEITNANVFSSDYNISIEDNNLNVPNYAAFCEGFKRNRSALLYDHNLSSSVLYPFENDGKSESSEESFDMLGEEFPVKPFRFGKKALGGWKKFLPFSKDYEHEDEGFKGHWMDALFDKTLHNENFNNCSSPCHQLINDKDSNLFYCTLCRQTKSDFVFPSQTEDQYDESIQFQIEQMKDAILRQPIAKIESSELAKQKDGKMYCSFCKTNSENKDFYQSHSLRDERGNITCPVLRLVECPYCYAKGDSAHTKKYCPFYNALHESFPAVRRLANGALASSSNHK